jgi:xylulose-5-phosphate/fructose-6-phosphate phosphoketolase
VLRARAHDPVAVARDAPTHLHQQMAIAVDACLDAIAARRHGDVGPWPMIVLRTPKGWGCPPVVDGQPVEGTFRAHQVPLPAARTDDEHRRVLEAWIAYRPEELFDDDGRPCAEVRDFPPSGTRRMSANPVANGGVLLRALDLPDWRDHTVAVPAPGGSMHEATRVLGGWLREVTRRNPDNFLLFAPDELASNRLQNVLVVTGRRWDLARGECGERLDPAGRVMEVPVTSVVPAEGTSDWLSAPSRATRRSSTSSTRCSTSAKWLRVERKIRVPPARSLNYLPSSHVWRQTTTASATRSRLPRRRTNRPISRVPPA